MFYQINKSCSLQSLQTTQFHFCQTGDNCWEAQGGVEEDVNQFIISPAVALSSHTAAVHYSPVWTAHFIANVNVWVEQSWIKLLQSKVSWWKEAE